MFTIEHPITSEKIQVSNQNFTQEMGWEKAKEACSKLGSGWRLPTIEELEVMYSQLFLKGQGNLRIGSITYWSSSEYNNEISWSFDFIAGKSSTSMKDGWYCVRAVRSL